MAYEACELANLARAAVPVGEHELDPDGTTRAPGTVLADAARVLAAAQRFFEAAAVFERVAGADWLLIGKILNVAPTPLECTSRWQRPHSNKNCPPSRELPRGKPPG
ncbi:hypothetical protein ACFQ0G_44185 [Streptomyces chiangmaiensis]